VELLINTLLEKFGTPDRKMAGFLLSSNIAHDLLLEIFRKLIICSVENNYLDFLLGLYQKDNPRLENQVIYLTLGNTLETKKNKRDIIFELAKLPVARRKLFERFVNMDKFPSYKYWLKAYLLQEKDLHGRSWAESLLLYGEWLSGDKPEPKTLNKIVKAEGRILRSANPYLTARVLGTQLLLLKNSKTANKIKRLLKEEHQRLKGDPYAPPLFSVSIFQYVLLGSRKDLGRLLSQNFQSYCPSKISHIDHNMGMLIKLARNFVNEERNSTLDEVRFFSTSIANDDVVLKYFSAGYALENPAKIKDYQNKLIIQSGYINLNLIEFSGNKASQLINNTLSS
jgi:hypothetical protein